MEKLAQKKTPKNYELRTAAFQYYSWNWIKPEKKKNIKLAWAVLFDQRRQNRQSFRWVKVFSCDRRRSIRKRMNKKKKKKTGTDLMDLPNISYAAAVMLWAEHPD